MKCRKQKPSLGFCPREGFCFLNLESLSLDRGIADKSLLHHAASLSDAGCKNNRKIHVEQSSDVATNPVNLLLMALNGYESASDGHTCKLI